MPYVEFKKFIRTLSNPIGIIPLDDSLFSSCKSPIKYFDYCLAGIPVICSHVPPYSDVVDDGVTGLLVYNDTHSWRNAIEQLVLSISLRKNITKQAILAIEKQHSMANSVLYWDLLFHKLQLGNSDQFVPPTVGNFVRQTAIAKYLLSHVFSIHSYKAALRIYKRESWKGIVSRLFPRWL